MNKHVSALLISLVLASILASIGILGVKEKLLLQEPILFKLMYARTRALEIETWIKENQGKLIWIKIPLELNYLHSMEDLNEIRVLKSIIPIFTLYMLRRSSIRYEMRWIIENAIERVKYSLLCGKFPRDNLSKIHYRLVWRSPLIYYKVGMDYILLYARGEEVAQLLFLNKTGKYLIEIHYYKPILHEWKMLKAWFAYEHRIERFINLSPPMESYVKYNGKAYWNPIICIALHRDSKLLNKIKTCLQQEIISLLKTLKGATDIALKKYNTHVIANIHLLATWINRTRGEHTWPLAKANFLIDRFRELIQYFPLNLSHIKLTICANISSNLINHYLCNEFSNSIFNALGTDIVTTSFIEITPWNMLRSIKSIDECLILWGSMYFNYDDLGRLRKGRIIIEYVNVSENYDGMTIYLRNLGEIPYPVGSKFKIDIYYFPMEGKGLEKIYVGEFKSSTPFKPKDLKTIIIPIDLKPYRGLAIYIIVTSPIGVMDAVAFILSSK